MGEGGGGMRVYTVVDIGCYGYVAGHSCWRVEMPVVW